MDGASEKKVYGSIDLLLENAVDGQIKVISWRLGVVLMGFRHGISGFKAVLCCWTTFNAEHNVS